MTFPGKDIGSGVTSRLSATRILVIDDEEIIRVLLREILNQAGYYVATAAGGQEGLDLLEREPFDLVIADMVMPDLDGVGVLQGARAIAPRVPIVVMSGYPSVGTDGQLEGLGAGDYITKPFSGDVVTRTVAKLLEGSRLHHAPAGSGG